MDKDIMDENVQDIIEEVPAESASEAETIVDNDVQSTIEETPIESEQDAEGDSVDAEASEEPESADTETSDEIESVEPEKTAVNDDEQASEDKDVEYVPSPYLDNQFLRFGFESDLDFISTKDSLAYLQGCGFDDNSLSQARERVLESAFLEQIYDPHKENCRYCDFCGAELSGVEYDIIVDGRERCNECSRTVLNTIEEFNDAYLEVKQNMEAMFGIRFFASVDVKTMDARKLARKLKIKFTPTAGFDGRVLGVAINERGIYRLYVENQSPYLNAVATIAHELTHIWQYVNWNRKAILKKYGKNMDKCIYEGMAKWVEIQYLYFINEPDRAYRELCATLAREDEYGIGLKLYLSEYELSNGVNIDIKTPFYDVDSPLHDA